MSNSEITVTPGTGKSVDTRTTTTDGNHRQVIVIGGPATDANVAPVDVTAGLKVNLGSDNDVVATATDLDIRALAETTDAVAIYGSDDAGTTKRIIKTDAGGAIQIDLEVAEVEVTSSALPAGASTSAKQLADGHNVTVDNAIGDEVYVAGSGTAGSADPAVLTVQGISSMTALSVTESTPLTGFATSAKQLADGHNVTIDNISTDEVYVRGGGTAGSATDGEVLAVQGIASGTAMAVTESTPLTGFATSAKQLADGHNVVLAAGTDLVGKVSIDQVTANANEVVVKSGTVTTVTTLTGITNDVSIDDGGNTITVDGAVTTTGTVALTNDSIIGAGDPTIDSYAHIAINLNAGADQVLVSSAANKQIWVYSVAYTCSVAGTVSFQDEDDTAVTGIMDHAANSGLATPATGNFAMPLWKLATDKDLEVDVTSASIDGWLSYAIVSV